MAIPVVRFMLYKNFKKILKATETDNNVRVLIN